MKSLGIALIGYGGIARSHAQGWRDLTLHYALPVDSVRMVGVATRREASAQAAAAELGGAIATTDAASLIQRDDVDVVEVLLGAGEVREIRHLVNAFPSDNRAPRRR